jgi:hypothetical protein
MSDSDECYACQQKESAEQSNTDPLDTSRISRPSEYQVIDSPAIHQRVGPNGIFLFGLDVFNKLSLSSIRHITSLRHDLSAESDTAR